MFLTTSLIEKTVVIWFLSKLLSSVKFLKIPTVIDLMNYFILIMVEIKVESGAWWLEIQRGVYVATYR